MGELSARQKVIITKLRACIAEVGAVCGEASSAHLDLMEVENELLFYFMNRALE